MQPKKSLTAARYFFLYYGETPHPTIIQSFFKDDIQISSDEFCRNLHSKILRKMSGIIHLFCYNLEKYLSEGTTLDLNASNFEKMIEETRYFFFMTFRYLAVMLGKFFLSPLENSLKIALNSEGGLSDLSLINFIRELDDQLKIWIAVQLKRNHLGPDETMTLYSALEKKLEFWDMGILSTSRIYQIKKSIPGFDFVQFDIDLLLQMNLPYVRNVSIQQQTDDTVVQIFCLNLVEITFKFPRPNIYPINFPKILTNFDRFKEITCTCSKFGQIDCRFGPLLWDINLSFLGILHKLYTKIKNKIVRRLIPQIQAFQSRLQNINLRQEIKKEILSDFLPREQLLKPFLCSFSTFD